MGLASSVGKQNHCLKKTILPSLEWKWTSVSIDVTQEYFTAYISESGVAS